MATRASKASAADKLRNNKAFQDFMQEVEDNQVKVFVTPDAKPEAIAEAHSIIRALSLIKGRLNVARLAQKIADKKAQ